MFTSKFGRMMSQTLYVLVWTAIYMVQFSNGIEVFQV
jgi:hypothetical protein